MSSINTHNNLDFVLEKKHESTLNNDCKNLKTTLVVEVIPNGIQYKIPINIEIKEINVEPIISTKSQSRRLFASKTCIRFGACDINDYLLLMLDAFYTRIL